MNNKVELDAEELVQEFLDDNHGDDKCNGCRNRKAWYSNGIDEDSGSECPVEDECAWVKEYDGMWVGELHTDREG